MSSSKRPSKVALLKTLRGAKQRKGYSEIYDVDSGTLSSDDPWQKELDFWFLFLKKKGKDTSALKDLQDFIKFTKIPHPKEIKKKHKGEFWDTIAEGASEYTALLQEALKVFLPNASKKDLKKS